MRSLPLAGLIVAALALTTVASQFPKSRSQPRIRVSCSLLENVILKKVTPSYPAEARARAVQGTVLVNVLVNKDGVPEKLQVVSGPPELVNASLEALRQWRYKPYKLNGVAVPVETNIRIQYVIPKKRSVSTTAKR